MIEIRAYRNPMSCKVEMLVCETRAGQIHATAPRIALQVLPPDDGVNRIEPTLSIPDETAQRLIDELWRCGFRPTEGTGSAGALAAVEKHLADMRQIAFAQLRTDKPA